MLKMKVLLSARKIRQHNKGVGLILETCYSWPEHVFIPFGMANVCTDLGLQNWREMGKFILKLNLAIVGNKLTVKIYIIQTNKQRLKCAAVKMTELQFGGLNTKSCSEQVCFVILPAFQTAVMYNDQGISLKLNSKKTFCVHAASFRQKQNMLIIRCGLAWNVGVCRVIERKLHIKSEV